ncbi:GNAT family N-acetyltransferase [Hyphococcus flavus]|uniref:GNAT family N-acetyltransferase n=1 Tax=Hyphococcus flavus TaxID=1866326 RepID=A0AAE9ZE98_9PROT|nr:GNAT family N-acetyltransferase [Hyphococcus flavus]WDI31128.1 GNAT family N-acetyltransferase [Hyphococcus flavus]
MTAQHSPLSATQKSNNGTSADQIEVTITYLEQTERPLLPPAPTPTRKTALMRAETPPVHFYRYLYDLVGGPWNWVSRRKLSDEELATIIQDPDVYFYVLYVDGAPAGMAEIDARDKQIHELKFFGLAPDFTGGGLGRYFLTHAVELLWSHGAQRVRLETCTLDHPAALPLYQKFGFTVIDRRKGFVEKLENL